MNDVRKPDARETALEVLMQVDSANAWSDGGLKRTIAKNKLDSRDAALFQPEQLFDAKQHTEIQAPEQEIPARSVPDTRQHPDNQNVDKLPEQSFPIAPQRNINIFLKPAA